MDGPREGCALRCCVQPGQARSAAFPCLLALGPAVEAKLSAALMPRPAPHGSATVLCAILIAEGQARGIADAEALLKAQRPRVSRRRWGLRCAVRETPAGRGWLELAPLHLCHQSSLDGARQVQAILLCPPDVIATQVRLNWRQRLALKEWLAGREELSKKQ